MSVETRSSKISGKFVVDARLCNDYSLGTNAIQLLESSESCLGHEKTYIQQLCAVEHVMLYIPMFKIFW